MPKDLKDKVALVTGGSCAIGSENTRHAHHRAGTGLEHVVYHLLVHRRRGVDETARREVDALVERREMEGGHQGAVEVQAGVGADLAFRPRS